MKLSTLIIVLLILGGSCNQKTNENKENANTSNVSNEYLYGVPPAPPYREAELEFTSIETGIESGCYDLDTVIVGYVIDYPQDDNSNKYVLIQHEDGVRLKYYIPYDSPNYILTSLPYVMIPGNKLEIEAVGCGNWGFRHFQYIRTLERK